MRENINPASQTKQPCEIVKEQIANQCKGGQINPFDVAYAFGVWLRTSCHRRTPFQSVRQQSPQQE